MSFITQGKTNLIYILIVIILVAIVGRGILWYTTQNDWKTYRDEKFRFEIKYPKDFIKQECKYIPEGLISLNSSFGLCFSIDAVYPELPVADNYQEPQEVSKLNIGALDSDYDITVTYKTLIDHEFFYLYYPFSDDYYLRISSQFNKKDNNDQINIFNRIIETFKYLDPTDKPVEWQTYTSKKYGYSVKYPYYWSFYNWDDYSSSPSIIGGVELKPGSAHKDSFVGFANVTIITKDRAQSIINSPNSTLKESIIIDNVEGTKILAPYHLGTQIIIILPLEKNYISIATGDIKYEEVFNQILSTFRFLE